MQPPTKSNESPRHNLAKEAEALERPNDRRDSLDVPPSEAVSILPSFNPKCIQNSLLKTGTSHRLSFLRNHSTNNHRLENFHHQHPHYRNHHSHKEFQLFHQNKHSHNINFH